MISTDRLIVRVGGTGIVPDEKCLIKKGSGDSMDDLFAPMHIVLLLVVALLVFGPKRLTHLGSDLAKGIREFQNELHGTKNSSVNQEQNATFDNKPSDSPDPHSFSAHSTDNGSD